MHKRPEYVAALAALDQSRKVVMQTLFHVWRTYTRLVRRLPNRNRVEHAGNSLYVAMQNKLKLEQPVEESKWDGVINW